MSEPTHNIIVIWSGAVADIPEGWKLCDGNNDTPDLRGNFILGVDPTKPPGTTGGNNTHTHDFTGSLHEHTIVAGNDIAAGADLHDTAAVKRPSGTTNPESNLPYYYALCFIMKK